MKRKSAAAELAGFIAKYRPEIQAEARAALAKLHRRLPGLVELVYDNYNGLVIGFGPTERPSEALFSLVLLPNWLTLCFLTGAKLPDPQRVLKGGGKIVRHVRLAGADSLDEPAIQTLIEMALEQAGVTLNRKAARRLIIKSISAKQRPRR